MRFDKAAVARALAEYSFSPDNQRFLRYWLSLWTDDGVALAAAPDAAEARSISRNCITFVLGEDGGVRLGRVGEAIAIALGHAALDADILAMARPEQRDVRLDRFTRTASGTLFRYRRRAVRPDGRAVLLEEIAAPLAGPSAAGARQTVTHIDISVLRPAGRVRVTPELFETVELADPLLDLADFRLPSAP
ncbi:MAG: hypothetical protein WDM86_17220 [Rhizomicrobium sp.]